MHFYPHHAGGPMKLPRSLRDCMRRRFGLPGEHLDALRCFGYDSTVNGKQVRRFRIYSPVIARQQNIQIAGMADLEKHPNMLLFEGYIDREGEAYVADRRTPLHAKRK